MKATKVGDIVRQLAAADKFLGECEKFAFVPEDSAAAGGQVSGHDEEWQVQRAQCAGKFIENTSMEETMVER